MEQSPIPELINNRYEVKETIGRGGMATVYLASDRRLGRDVAIKVLKPELARDDSFQERFQREAQAVAGLNHHTITSVYDTGEIPPDVPSDVACPFIVMEYVPGQTLRQLIREDRLSTEESVHAMEGILDALAYSHRSGIVHRDIKPANVVITPDNRVKVMDFGIARAVEDTQAALTQTQAVLGTAQYLSPEQARGENVDARSDLYSAACVFFEMLTGRAPFVGEASVDIAAQHVRDAPPQPSSLAPQLHPDFDEFMGKALAKPRDARFQTAEEMRQAVIGLRGVSEIDATTMTRPVGGASALGASAAGAGTGSGQTGAQDRARIGSEDQDGPHTQVAGAAAGAGLGAGAAAGAAQAAGPAGEGSDASAAAPVFTIKSSADEPQAGPGPELDPDAPRGSRPAAARDEEREGRAPLLWLIPLLLLAGAAIAAFLWFGRGPDSVEIPEVVGVEADEAQSQLDDAGLSVEVEEELSTDVPRDHVVSVEPGEGSEVDEGSTVTLTVSEGSEAVTVPTDLEGQSESYAREMISAAGLEPEEQTRTRNSPDVPADMVVATDPEGGEEVARDSSVGIVLSTGRVTVPDVTGMTQEEASDRLAADDTQLETAVAQTETTDQPAGTVVRQSVDGGDDVSQGSTITITVAAAPADGRSSTGDGGGGSGGETGGNAGGGSGGNTGGDTPGGSTGGSSGGDTGGSTGGAPGGNADDTPGGNTGGNTGGDAGGDTGGDTGSTPGGNTGGDTDAGAPGSGDPGAGEPAPSAAATGSRQPAEAPATADTGSGSEQAAGRPTGGASSGGSGSAGGSPSGGAPTGAEQS